VAGLQGGQIITDRFVVVVRLDKSLADLFGQARVLGILDQGCLVHLHGLFGLYDLHVGIAQKDQRVRVLELVGQLLVGGHVEPLFLAVLEVDGGHLLARLHVIGLGGLDLFEQAEGVVNVAAAEQQVNVGHGDSRLFAGAFELVDGVLHGFGCLVLQLVEQKDVR